MQKEQLHRSKIPKIIQNDYRSCKDCVNNQFCIENGKYVIYIIDSSYDDYDIKIRRK